MVKYLTKENEMDKFTIEEVNNLHLNIGHQLFSECMIHKGKKPPSPLQAKIVKYMVEHQDEVITQKVLEEQFYVSKVTISGAINAMEKQGFITRKSSDEDKRSKVITLTDKSIQHLEEMKQIFVKVNQKMIQDISKEDMECFEKVIQKMNQNLKGE